MSMHFKCPIKSCECMVLKDDMAFNSHLINVHKSSQAQRTRLRMKYTPREPGFKSQTGVTREERDRCKQSGIS